MRSSRTSYLFYSTPGHIMWAPSQSSEDFVSLTCLSRKSKRKERGRFQKERKREMNETSWACNPTSKNDPRSWRFWRSHHSTNWRTKKERKEVPLLYKQPYGRSNALTLENCIPSLPFLPFHLNSPRGFFPNAIPPTLWFQLDRGILNILVCILVFQCYIPCKEFSC